MKKYTALLLVVVLAGCHHKLIKELKQKEYVTTENNSTTVIMINSEGCGYSAWAKKTLVPILERDSIPLLLLTSFSDTLSLQGTTKVVGANYLTHYKYKFFPQFLVIQPNGKVKHIKGIDKKRKEMLLTMVKKKI